MTRRTFLAATALSGCGRRLAPRYNGWLFVASAGERGVAVADLAEFRRLNSIPLFQVPRQVLPGPNGVFVTCPDAHTLFVLDPARLVVSQKIDLRSPIVAAAMVPGDRQIAVLTERPSALYLVDAEERRVAKRIALPGSPGGLDVTENMAAVADRDGNSVVRISLEHGRVVGVTPLGTRCGTLNFRKDDATILVAAPDANQVVTIDAATGALLARLPLPFAPERFCFVGNGGQMFVTGSPGDAITIVDPYQNEVDQTFVAGSKPAGMAIGTVGPQELLFVTNAGSGDLTIFDIEHRRLAASVHIGGNPGQVLVTPNGEYGLIVNRDSGDVAVVRLSTILNRGVKTKPLFTVFPTGAGPQSAAIIPRPA